MGFVYLPMNFQNGEHLGYALVNFPDHALALRFLNTEISAEVGSICEMSWTHPLQGLNAHVERYRNSPVLHPTVLDEYKPAFFSGGVRMPFPEPTKVIKVPKIRPARKNA